MLYSLNYNSPLKQEADEVRCPYNQLGLAVKIVKDRPQVRINISIPKEPDAETRARVVKELNLLQDITTNYTLECADFLSFYGLRELEHPCYLSFPVTDWETFQEIKALGVSDIYIDGPLGFQTTALRNGKGDVKVRATPTFSPNHLLTTRPASDFFFIRPEDLYLYEDTIDIVSFPVHSLDQEEALFKIYKRGSFLYELDRVIPQSNQKVLNSFIKPDFGERRLNCRQRCKTPGYSCHLCNTEFHVTNQVVEYFSQKIEEGDPDD